MGDSGNKTMYNIGGGIVGILLAGLAIFGLVQSQGSEQPQKYHANISYDG